MKKLPIILLALFLAACAPDHGTVRDKRHEDAWVQYIPGTSGTTSCSGKPVRCTTTPGTPPRFTSWPESWSLDLDDGKDRGWQDVDHQAFDRCDRGEAFPQCSKA